ncbi:unnamed protein product [Protopolystoma xenopodis]|uniref:Uncharacterized protein n=1 Tax=Protopolystoma xenopodis TaxID=117903 RepID=A0A3S5FFR4_9PLAT|nr:unnamed protein product [Protopolystoma xenopodis]
MPAAPEARLSKAFLSSATEAFPTVEDRGRRADCRRCRGAGPRGFKLLRTLYSTGGAGNRPADIEEVLSRPEESASKDSSGGFPGDQEKAEINKDELHGEWRNDV